jgi:Carboxypeptidase regulatory-like domain
MSSRSWLPALALLWASAASAQLNTGTITGTVTDPSGALVPGVKVAVRNSGTNVVRETASSSAGVYTVSNLMVGTYDVTFQAPSFKKLVRAGITLDVTQVARVDATMEVGAVTDSVEVTGQLPYINTDSPEVGANLNRADLLDVPLSISGGRYPEALAYSIMPGASGGTWTSHINGSASFSKEVLLDGASVTTYMADFAETSVSSESLQEMKLQTSGQSAEFGRSQGGLFNFVLKSGSNQVHGSGYFAMRNEALDANTFTNKFRGAPRAIDRLFDYAFSFGGPIYIPKVYNGKSRSFFYTTYERYKQRAIGPGAPTQSFPTPDEYAGNFSALLGPATGQTDALGNPVYRGAIYDPATFSQLPSGRWIGTMFPGNIIPAARISKVSKTISAMALACCLPTVKDASGNYPLLNNAVQSASGTPLFDQYNFTEKVDQTINDRNRLSASYSYNYRPRYLNNSGGNLWDASSPLLGGPLFNQNLQQIHSSLARASWDRTISPRLLNNFTVFYNRMNNPNFNQQITHNGAKEWGIANIDSAGYPSVNWGAGPIYGLSNIGNNQDDFQAYNGNGLTDTVSFSHGRHFLKAGIDLRRNYTNDRPHGNPSFTFNALETAIPNEAASGVNTGYSFASFLLGTVHSAGMSQPVGLGEVHRYYGAFIQDDFKVNPRLTINLGLRYEVQSPFHEDFNRIAAWSPTQQDPLSGLNGAYIFGSSCSVCTGQTYFGNIDWKDFGPRVGFAWQPMNKWTIRGAYGIFYSPDTQEDFGLPTPTFPWAGTYNLGANPINPWQGIFNWDNGFPTNAFVPPTFNRSYADNIGGATMIDPHYNKIPYVQQWNLNIQRELPGNIVLDVGYVANKGTRQKDQALAAINQLPVSVLSRFGTTLNSTVASAADAAKYGIPYPYPGFSGTVASALRQYPQIRANSTITDYAAPLGFSTFNSLQITVNKRFSKGLNVYADYVWSKAMSNGAGSACSGCVSNAGPLDYYNLQLEKAPVNYNQPQVFKAYVNYQLPLGRGQALLSKAPRAVDTVVGGWAMAWIMNYASGTPLSFAAPSPLATGWNGATNRDNIAAGNMHNSAFDRTVFNYANTSSPTDTYLNKSLFSAPAPLTLGTSAPAYTSILGFGTISENVSLSKNLKIKERFKWQLRIEFYDVFNRHQLSGINTTITSPLFGQVTNVTGNRTSQIGTRLDF